MLRHIQYVMSLPPTSRPNWTDAKWTIAPPLIKIQTKERLSSVHFIRDRKHVYLFVLGFFFTVICHFDWTVKPVNQISRQVNYGIISNVIFRHVLINARVRLQLISNNLDVIVKKKNASTSKQVFFSTLYVWRKSLTHNCRLKINEYGPGDMLPRPGLAEEGVERVVHHPYGLVARHLTIWLYPMFQAVQLPACIAHLAPSLSNVDGNTFTLKFKCG